MPLAEFDLIARYFSDCGHPRGDVALGIGDDCALLRVPGGKQLVVGVDTLVEAIHFPPDTAPGDLGYKSLAVNLSDLAAMGAQPAWATLALTLPAVDPDWVRGFAGGFCELAAASGVRLVGGDTTRGPRAVSVQVLGLVDPGGGLRRSGAAPGDRIYVTGTLGDAGLALKALHESRWSHHLGPELRRRLDRPTPRVAEGIALGRLASAAIDISDGLAADLGHLLSASGVGAVIDLERVPLGPQMRRYLAETGDYALPLTAGDDYELCFSVPSPRVPQVEVLGTQFSCGFTLIGEAEALPGLRLRRHDGSLLILDRAGYQHFVDS